MIRERDPIPPAKSTDVGGAFRRAQGSHWILGSISSTVDRTVKVCDLLNPASKGTEG